ncbi:MAG: DUF1349 domain-containing protein [Dactylosporangium sp.]|nr:DUF1349 domain-containing protein [Dactylosporangium sp.]
MAGRADARRRGSGPVEHHRRGRTDRFVDPQGLVTVLNAPAAVVDLDGDGDYQLSARVDVDFGADYDAGALLLWADAGHFAKLCFEISPQGRPMVVSVVTRGVSDDANAFLVEGCGVWLRVSRLGSSYVFHASTDGKWWDIVRYFALGSAEPVAVGFHVQSPVGEGCRAAFSDIRFVPQRLADPRDGS